MKKILYLFSISFFILLVTSCTKEDLAKIAYKEDPNNYFTATFNGKTIKTSGLVITSLGVPDYSSGVALVNAYLYTRNNSSGGVTTDLDITAYGSAANTSWDMFKFPTQKVDASISLTKTGNATGTYKLEGSWAGEITDLSVGKKAYDLDEATTTFNVTLADEIYVQGTYSGNLIDGSSKIPVTGSFKLRKR